MDHSASVTRKSEANFVNSCELQYALIIVPLERTLRLSIFGSLAMFVRGSAVTYTYPVVLIGLASGACGDEIFLL